MRDIGYKESFDFTTNKILFQNIKGSHLRSSFNLTPSWVNLWDFKILGIFLNQLTDFKPIDTKPTRKIVKNGQYIRYFKFCHKDLGNLFSISISIYIDQNFEINVSISRELLKINTIFTEKEESSFLYSYSISFPNLNLSSQAILDSETLAFFQLNDFSQSFIYFSNSITKNFINNQYTNFFFQFIKIFFKRPNYFTIISLEQLKTQTRGYLKFLITKKKIKRFI